MSHVIITDLDQVKRLAQQQYDAFEVLRYSLELREDLSDETIDSWVENMAVPIIEAIDCTQCGNCCRSLEVSLTRADVERLAAATHFSIKTFTTHYITSSESITDEDWGGFHQIPCPFLRGNLCAEYTHRPEACRIYPSLTPDFRWTMEHTIEGAAFCPIIYNVLTKLVEEVDTL